MSTLNDSAPVPSALPEALAQFGRLLRDQAGLPTSTSQVIALQQAVDAFQTPDLEDLYWAGRTCLGIQPGDRAVYDALFGDFWLGDRSFEQVDDHDADESRDGDGGPPSAAAESRRLTPVTGQVERDTDETADLAGGEASTIETLSVTPFDACTEEEQALLRSLIRRLHVRPPHRLSRRMAPSMRRGRLDLRRTVRSSLPTQGDLVRPRWRARRLRPRRIVMFLDVSRSMAPYSRLLLHFAHAMSSSGLEVEVVCFGTRVTRVTRLIRRHRSARALEDAAAAVLDWDGGTRIGEAVRAAQSIGTVRGALRGSVVIMLSDGLEQDDPQVLAQALARLRRTCHSLIWANPLAGDARYEPLTGGMQAALPYIDTLCAGDSLAALEQVAARLNDLAADRPAISTYPASARRAR
jgi:uncharacterized protein with von Willebrand factor type A (vWA) domain